MNFEKDIQKINKTSELKEKLQKNIVSLRKNNRNFKFFQY
jgi:hypothetical protein